MSVHELWGPSMFSWPGLWLLAAPAALWFRSGRSLREWVRRGSDPLAMLLGITAALVTLSLLAMRHRILLAPVVASLVGACVSAFANEGRDGPAQRRVNRGGAARVRAIAARAPIVERLALAAFVLCFAILARDAWTAAVKSVTRLDPGMSAVIAYLRAHGERGPLLSFWDRGYELQRYAGCATFSDGMLESDVNQKHIIAAARAFLASTPDSLAALCERFGVELLIVPPTWFLLGEAMAAGDPLANKVSARLSLTPHEADRVVIRMMLAGTVEPPFQPVFEGGHYRIYRRMPPSLPGRGASP